MVRIDEAINLKLLGQWLQDGGIGLLAGVVVAYATTPSQLYLWYFTIAGILFLAVGGMLTISAEESEERKREEAHKA